MLTIPSAPKDSTREISDDIVALKKKTVGILNEIVAPLVRQLPWSHNLIILSASKRDEEREFYIRLAIHEKWTKRELKRPIFQRKSHQGFRCFKGIREGEQEQLQT
jgi:hypothetical protein